MALALSTHVLDVAHGVPAADLEISLYRIDDGERRHPIATGVADENGRVASPFGGELAAGTYELVFHVGAYYAHHDVAGFYTDVPVRFRMSDPKQHYHVPLLLSPWGYTTYRGS
jgi:5-hydroxyisourate hydrolase